MHFHKLAWLLALILPFQALAAKQLNSEEETLAVCRQGAELINQKALSFDKAADFIEPYWVSPKEELRSLQYNANKLLNLMNDRHGGAVGVTFVKTDSVADKTFINHSFLLKREKHALVVSCLFYRPHNTWQLNGFNFHDSPAVLFD